MLRARMALLAALTILSVAGCVEQESGRPTEADWTVIKQNILKAPPAKFSYKVDGDFEGKVVYLGLDVDRPQIKAGEQFTLTHYWQVKKPVAGWRVFTHLQDPKHQGKYFVNADHRPIGGRYPAAMWKVGEIIRDVHKITLNPRWDAPEVNVYVGLWKGKLRMKPAGPTDGQNRLRAATLKVVVNPAAAKKVAGRPVPQLVATRTEQPVKIDGKLDDAVWAKARPTAAFVNTMNGSPSPLRTSAKVAWDDKHLYVAFDNVDDDIWTSFTKRDDKLWTQEAVEIFIDANGDGRDYIELQISPNGTIFDSYLSAYRKNDNAWNSGLQAAVQVDGTLNKRGDKDKGWTVEVAIPWADTKGKGAYALRLPPKAGDRWRINFFRMDLPAKKPQLAAAWSAPMVGDFHRLDRFGTLIFGDASGLVPPAPVPPRPATAAVVRPTVLNVPLMKVAKMPARIVPSVRQLRRVPRRAVNAAPTPVAGKAAKPVPEK